MILLSHPPELGAFSQVLLYLALFVVLKVFLTHRVFCMQLPALQILDKDAIP